MKFPNEIKAYQTSDGALHVGYADAVAHEHEIYIDSKVAVAHEVLYNIWSDGSMPTPATTKTFLALKAVKEAIIALGMEIPILPNKDAITALVSAATELLHFVKDALPESNCGCHLNAPCDDCVNNAFPRELCSALEEALKTIQKGDQK